MATALPAAVAIVGGALLSLLMCSNAARISPAALEWRALQNLDRGAAADAAIDYRRLLQQAPGEAKYVEGLRAAMNARGERVSP